MWSKSQMTALAVVVLVLGGFLLVKLARNPMTVSDPAPVHPAREAELLDRVDPNEAEMSVLASLPGMGERTARAIMTYREQHAKDHPGQPAFLKIEDMLKVKGLGVGLMESMEPYLRFPKTDRPTTRP